jgi:hypothetical protein
MDEGEAIDVWGNQDVHTVLSQATQDLLGIIEETRRQNDGIVRLRPHLRKRCENLELGSYSK